MIGIIGYKGFIGSAMIRACQRAGHNYLGIGRDESIKDNCNFIIDCNGNSKKFEVNRNPGRGFEEIVQSVTNRLHQTKKNQEYIYISSGEVYGFEQLSSLERDPIDSKEISFYGSLKFQAEELIRTNRDNHLIIRPSGFVGNGLLKNPIYDLLRGQELFIHPDSRFQFCDVDWFADTVVWLSLQKMTGVWNVSATETVSIKEVSEMAKLIIGRISPEAKIEHHELSMEKLENFLNIPTTRDVVKNYIAEIVN
jgi:nucleoside-diphosphate-sugar epimerase